MQFVFSCNENFDQFFDPAYAGSKNCDLSDREIGNSFCRKGETFKQTMDFIPKLKPDGVIFSIFTPYPGSDIYEECKDQGIITGEFDLVLYNHQSPLNCFTKHIPKERFYELRKKAFDFVDKYNGRAKFSRGISSLYNLGLIYKN